MTKEKPRSGYTLPVFATASAIASLQWLKQRQAIASVTVDLINPAETVEIAIEQVSGISETTALAITRSDPGDNLDMTRNTPVWALVELSRGAGEQGSRGAGEQITLRGGEGIGRLLDTCPPERRLRLPMRPGARSLNLSNCVAIVAYEAWRQLGWR